MSGCRCVISPDHANHQMSWYSGSKEESMRVALISDIHANRYALEAVLEDSEKYGTDQYICLGDTVYFGLYPGESYRMVRELNPLTWIKGNTDANIEDLDEIAPSSQFEQYLLDIARFTRDSLQQSEREALASAPVSASLEIEGQLITFCHGSPYSLYEKLVPSGETEETTAMRLQDEKACLICCGHTHIPGDFVVGSKRVINPGAIGYSFDGDTRTGYALLDISEGGISYHPRRVEWEKDSYKKELEQALGHFPLFESILYALRNGAPMNDFKKKFSR